MRPQPAKSQLVRAFLLGGLLPLLAFTWIEETYGTLAGMVAGMLMGTAEMLYERFRLRRIEPVTWFGNGLIIVLGGIGLIFHEGVLFKLQPAILEAVMSAVFLGSVMLKRPFLWEMMKKQRAQMGEPLEALPEPALLRIKNAIEGLSIRIGIFMGLQAALATWAAIAWSTRSWALLKGVGFTGSFGIYFLVETLYLRKRLRVRSPN